MPISANTFVRSTAALLLVGLLALLGIVGTSIWLVERSQAYFNDLIEARDARTAAVDLRTALQDAETGQRGFLLTRTAYLEPYTGHREHSSAHRGAGRGPAARPQAGKPWHACGAPSTASWRSWTRPCAGQGRPGRRGARHRQDRQRQGGDGRGARLPRRVDLEADDR